MASKKADFDGLMVQEFLTSDGIHEYADRGCIRREDTAIRSHLPEQRRARQRGFLPSWAPQAQVATGGGCTDKDNVIYTILHQAGSGSGE